MTKKNKEHTINFAISGIELSAVKINKPSEQPASFENYAFNIQIQFRMMPNEKGLLASVSIGVVDSATQFDAASLEVTIAYRIENYDEVVTTDKENKTLLPTPFIDVINSISLSTCRGILFSQFRGTYLHNLVMPIVDPKGLPQGIIH